MLIFVLVVSNISKISIKQQFTTIQLPTWEEIKLFRIFQRSQLNSNSQRMYPGMFENFGCFEYFKDLN